MQRAPSDSQDKKRQAFLQASSAGVIGLVNPPRAQGKAGPVKRKPPNILFTMTNPQHAGATSNSGTANLSTSDIDIPARRGVSFTKARIHLLPTLFEHASIQAPQELPRISPPPVAEEKTVAASRPIIISQTEQHANDSSSGDTYGRIVRTQQNKYILWPEGDKQEQLFDLEKDSGVVKDPKRGFSWDALCGLTAQISQTESGNTGTFASLSKGPPDKSEILSFKRVNI